MMLDLQLHEDLDENRTDNEDESLELRGKSIHRLTNDLARPTSLQREVFDYIRMEYDDRAGVHYTVFVSLPASDSYSKQLYSSRTKSSIASVSSLYLKIRRSIHALLSRDSKLSDCQADLTAAELCSGIIRIYDQDLHDDALDVLYDKFNDLLLAGRFDVVDAALLRAVSLKMPILLCLGVLTITLRAKDRLSNRDRFFQYAVETVKLTGSNPFEVLHGLE